LDLVNYQVQVLGSHMFARPTLPWTWLTVKSKCLGSNIFVKLILPHSLGRAKGG
jgi:hypothetical protein